MNAIHEELEAEMVEALDSDRDGMLERLLSDMRGRERP